MDDCATNLIELVPFIHQVGGHSFMLCFDDSTVCKSLVPREHQFYQTIPEEVKKFTPAFLGVTKVHTVPDSDGYLHFFAVPPSDLTLGDISKRVRFRKSGSVEAINEESVFFVEDSEKKVSDLNPWVIKCHQEAAVHSSLTANAKDFIVLENLTFNFTFPCVMDLKVGTRQYGDTASLAKMQSKMVKVVSTTSAKLGLRVGGMQVYQTRTRKYLCRDKFYGRSLSVAGFQQALFQFLHNGARFRSDVLPGLIAKLEELAAAVERLDAIRFYTTSLLLLYEGEDGEMSGDNDDDGERKVVENDFHRSASKDSDVGLRKKTLSAESLAYDDGNIGSIPSPRRRNSSIANHETSNISETSSNSSSSSNVFEEHSPRYNSRKTFRDRTFSTKSDPGCPYPSSPRVDVRMIDFAHSTHKELDKTNVYSGPDRGFLFGLEKLIAMLKSMVTDYG